VKASSGDFASPSGYHCSNITEYEALYLSQIWKFNFHVSRRDDTNSRIEPSFHNLSQTRTSIIPESFFGIDNCERDLYSTVGVSNLMNV